MKRKVKPKAKPGVIFLVILAVIVLIAIFYFLTGGELDLQPSGNFTPNVSQQWNCGDMRIDLNSIKEALYYYRFGIQRSATENYKFETLNLTVTNKANVTKDFSGHRMELIADSKTSIPVIFNEMERITLIDNSTIDYTCRELALASVSRFELNAGESSTGCKIFRVLKDSSPTSLSVYSSTDLICTIQL